MIIAYFPGISIVIQAVQTLQNLKRLISSILGSCIEGTQVFRIFERCFDNDIYNDMYQQRKDHTNIV